MKAVGVDAKVGTRVTVKFGGLLLDTTTRCEPFRYCDPDGNGNWLVLVWGSDERYTLDRCTLREEPR